MVVNSGFFVCLVFVGFVVVVVVVVVLVVEFVCFPSLSCAGEGFLDV